MSNSIYSVPYTYHIAWSNINKHYYGVRYAKGCNPKDLWVSYFTSSKLVTKHRKKYGEPDIIEIRRTFDNSHKAIIWESKVLRRLKVLKNDKWLNANIGGDQYIIRKHSPETIKKMSENNASKRPEVRRAIAMRQTGVHNSFYGKKHTSESNEKRKKALLGIKRSKEFKENRMGEKNVAKRSDVRILISQKVKQARKNDPIVSCVNCRKVIKGAPSFSSHLRKCFTS
jgi:NUMOD3 motif